jgi:dTDP-4-amino-4,6-dideoxygalactose transaminase
MRIPLLDLQAQYLTIQAEVEAAVFEVLRSGQYILGPKVEECERAVAAYSRCDYGVGVSSGTDALLACLMAEGIGLGDEVVTTPYTFFATAGSIVRLGATPIFVDVDPQTCNIDPSLIEARITPRTKALVPVHLFGQCADMDPILDIARRHNLVVIEDAAQALGAEYQGRRAGSMGHYGCFSFFPSKNLGCAGDGGMVVTQDATRAEKLRILRAHGSQPKYHHKLVGGNFRLDALQAAIVLAKLPHLDAWTAARQANAGRYRELFAQSGLVESGLVTLSHDSSLSPDPCSLTPPCRHIYNQLVIRVPRRDELQACLKAQGIATEVYYPVPMHLQECFTGLGHTPGRLPHSERAAEETLALPVSPELSREQARQVVDAIARFFKVGQ